MRHWFFFKWTHRKEDTLLGWMMLVRSKWSRLEQLLLVVAARMAVGEVANQDRVHVLAANQDRAHVLGAAPWLGVTAKQHTEI